MAPSAVSASRWKAAPSANSSAAEQTFAAFLAGSFAQLRQEVPQAYAAMCRRLAPRAVRLSVGDEVIPLVFSTAEVRAVAALERPQIEVVTSRTAVLAVIDATSSLLQAVLADRLALRGAPDDLLAFHDGLMAYVHGAVRAPSFPALLRAFRGAAPPPGSGRSHLPN